MSLMSSTATLAPPSAAAAPPPSAGTAKPNPKRRASHSHTAHRRASEHHHAHRRPSQGHGHGHTGLGGLGGLTALTATVSNGSDGSENKTRRKGSKREERPPARASRSDTHLPRLSRVNSSTSTTSHKSMSQLGARTPPSTTVIQGGDTPDPTPHKAGKTKQEEDEGDWESGSEEEEEQTAASSDMRRTVSDTTAVTKKKEEAKGHQNGSPTGSPKATKPNINPLQTKKRASSIAKHSVLGFGGLTRTPMTEEPAAMEREPSGPGFARGDEPGHVGIVPPAKRQMSSVNLHNLPSRKPSAELHGEQPAPLTPDEDTDSDRTEASEDESAPAPVKAPTPLRKQASHREVTPDMNGSPTKRMPSQSKSESSREAQSQPLQHTQSQPEVQSRSRVASQNHTLRHRPSYSSLRSTSSFRTPPHPLNSTTTAAAAIGMSSRQRVSSMHVPPLAPPEVSTAVAEGHGWEGLPDEAEPSSSQQPPTPQRPNHMRKSSVSSSRSIRSLFAPQQGRYPGQHVTDGLSANGRLTALAATTAASKLHTTTDPQLYHSSLGYSSTEAETAHLISRFLPVKESEVRRQSVLGDSPFASGHRSLVETMKNLGIGTYASAGHDHFTVTGSSVGPEHAQYQRQDTRLKGKTPLELSFDRCRSLRVERGIDLAPIVPRAAQRSKSTLGPFRGE